MADTPLKIAGTNAGVVTAAPVSAAETGPVPAAPLIEPKVEVVEEEPGSVMHFTSSPIQRFNLGDYQFENATLTLRSEEEVDAFEAMLKTLPLSEQLKIRKIDLVAAEAVSRAVRASQGFTTQEIDSSTGDRAPPPVVGKGNLLNSK